jgi:hypothetical protein
VRTITRSVERQMDSLRAEMASQMEQIEQIVQNG